MSKRLSVWSLLAFSSPGIPATLLIAPVFGILPSYYALHTKVTLAEVGAAFLLARIIDAIIDPLVGTLSDRTNSRLGARLPWMIVGAILAIPSAYFFFMPPVNAGALYFFFASFLTMAAWSLLAIPHGAWAAELSDDYDERSRIFSYKQVLATIGGYSLFFIPPALAPYDLELSDEGNELIFNYDTKGDRTGITSLLSDLRDAGIRFNDLDTNQSSLEDIFVSLVRAP